MIDESADHRVTVALAQEGEEVAAVQVIAVERKAAAFRIHFAQRARTARDFRSHKFGSDFFRDRRAERFAKMSEAQIISDL